MLIPLRESLVLILCYFNLQFIQFGFRVFAPLRESTRRAFWSICLPRASLDVNPSLYSTIFGHIRLPPLSGTCAFGSNSSYAPSRATPPMRECRHDWPGARPPLWIPIRGEKGDALAPHGGLFPKLLVISIPRFLQKHIQEFPNKKQTNEINIEYFTFTFRFMYTN